MGSSRERQATLGEPATQQVAGASCRQTRQRRSRQGARQRTAGFVQVDASQCLRDRGAVGLMASRPRQRALYPRPATLEARQDLVSDVVAVDTLVGIAGIFQPRQMVAHQVVTQGLRAGIEQRAGQPALTQRRQRRHAGETGGPGAAHQLQQQGFGLVALMMGRANSLAVAHQLRQRLIARPARRCFRTLPLDGTRIDPRHHQCHFEVRAQAAAATLPDIGLGMQSMVHVDGRDVRRRQHLTQLAQSMQQRDRIRPAAQRHPV